MRPRLRSRRRLERLLTDLILAIAQRIVGEHDPFALTPLEASATVSHALASGLFLGAEVRHLTHNRDGFFTGHALFIGPKLYMKVSESTVIKAAWSIQVPDETSGNMDLVN